MKTMALLIVVLSNVVGQVLFKKVALDLAGETEVKKMAIFLLSSQAWWGAIFFYLLTIVLWVYVLRVTPLSVAYASISAIFILVPICGLAIFGEPLTKNFILGALFICIGIILVSKS
jgi:drug/metabolite transporter (DMT)-like permease